MVVMKWGITSECSLSCKHCYNADIRNANSTHSVVELNEAIVEKVVKEFSENYVSCVHFLGGEPFMSNMLVTALAMCFKYSIKTEINTNGVLITPSMLDALFAYEVDAIIFSIDGYSAYSNDAIRGKGTYFQARCALDNLFRGKKDLQSNIRVCVNSVIGKAALQNPNELFDFLLDYPDLHSVSISVPDIVGNARNHYNLWPSHEEFFEYILQLMEGLEGFKGNTLVSFGVPPLVRRLIDQRFNTKLYRRTYEYCMGSSRVMYLDSDGIIYPCNLPPGINWFKDVFGYQYLRKNCSILSRSFQDIYSSPEYLEFFQYVRSRDLTVRKRLIEGICIDCSESPWCQIACPMETNTNPLKQLCELALNTIGGST